MLRPPNPARARAVAVVCSTYPPIMGGVETYNHHVAHALARAGCRVAVATRFVRARAPGGMAGLLGRSEPHQRLAEPDGVRVEVMTPRPAFLLRPVYRLHFYPSTVGLAARLFGAAHRDGLARALDGAEAVHYSGTGRELLGFAALRHARRKGIPFIVTTHLHTGAWGDGPVDFALYRRADAVLAATEYERSFVVRNGVDPARVHVLGHGVNVDGSGDGARFRGQHGLGEAPIVLFLARKARYKGYGLLREAAPLVWARVPEARFVFAGPSEDGAPTPPNDDARMIDLGVLKDHEREDAYAACTAFCVPSEAESFGLAYLEAWRYARPVVALGIPTVAELVGGAGGGLLAEPTAASIADALVDLLTNPVRAAALGAAGARRADGSTWDHVARRLLQIYADPAGALAERANVAAPEPAFA